MPVAANRARITACTSRCTDTAGPHAPSGAGASSDTVRSAITAASRSASGITVSSASTSGIASGANQANRPSRVSAAGASRAAFSIASAKVAATLRG